MKRREKVIVGLSGGVDSSVAALLLLQAGYEVEGLFMRNWDSAANSDLLGNPDLEDDVCPQEVDYADAQAVADKLGIKLHRHDFIQEYWDDVFHEFLQEYEAGRTPNPDILCNKHIKFRSFWEVAKDLGADWIAMGHYARVLHDEDHHTLLRGVDMGKDQTYFLCQLSQEQLSHTLFPIGHLQKKEVRRLAEEAGLITAKKKDSTGICFIGERRFAQFLANYLPAKPGVMKTQNGDVVGEHDGVMYYTIGQRKGLKIGGIHGRIGAPWFVVGKSVEQNILYVEQGIDNEALLSDECTVEGINWISGRAPEDPTSLTAKFRYRQEDVEITITIVSPTEVLVHYPSRVRAVTPGQACVFYQGDICLGGGTINQVFSDGIRRPY